MSEQHTTAGTKAVEPDLSGRRLGDYHLLRRLGRGGMADVYLAQQESLGRQVAVKVLKTSLAQDASYVRRFQNEARAAAALVHANIVQIHEVGCLDGMHFIAQEYVDGQSLRQLLERQGVLQVAVAVNILRQVAAALHKAGQQKITHRDIKPDNVMLSTGGEVKVADFGLARVERPGPGLDVTQVGMTMGTPLYMSPEQVEGRPVDTRSDIYSLGVTCYHMLAGRPPFQGDTPLNIAVQHLKNEPTPLEDLRPDVPAGLCRIVRRMMAKRPEDRFQNAADLLQELRTFQSEGQLTGVDEWTTPELLALAEQRSAATRQLDALMKTESLARQRRRVVWLGWAAAVAGAFGLGGMLAWATRPAPLLAVSEKERPSVPRQPSAREQYLWAVEAGTEAAWKSVAEFFPPESSEQNKYYALRAKQRLAELYIDHGALDPALQCYETLAQADATQLQFQVIGLAGQASVFMMKDEAGPAKQKLVAVARLYPQLSPDARLRLLQEVHPRVRADLERLVRETRGTADSRKPAAPTPWPAPPGPGR